MELSSTCNLSCPECVTGRGLTVRESRFISYDLAALVASQLHGTVLSAWLSFQGEPMMHPQFFSIVNLFTGMHPVIATNGHWLDAASCEQLAVSPLKEIIISYDGVTPEVYGIYRAGGDHARVTEGIRRLARTIEESRSQLKITLQFLIHRGNEHQVGEAAAFAKSVGAGFVVKSMQVLDLTRAGGWAPADPRLSRYVRGSEAGRAADQRSDDSGDSGYSGDSGGSGRSGGSEGGGGSGVGDRSDGGSSGGWRTKGMPARGCFRMWRSAVITSDGHVVPCCFDKEGKYVMGSIKEQSFSGIWHSESYRQFRAAVMERRDQVEICRDCPEGTRLLFRRG